MFPLRKFITILLLVSVLPVTIILITVKILLSVNDSQEITVQQTRKKLNPTIEIYQEPDPYISKELPLKLFAPPNGTTVFLPSVTVKGLTKPYAQVQINEASSAADLSGNFSIPLLLGTGKNPILVTVTDEFGKRSVMEISVIFDDSKLPTILPSFSPTGIFNPQYP